jgi:transglutaminase-like putative cysteine protease
MRAPDYTVVSAQRLLWTATIIAGASLPHWPTLPIWVSALLLVCIVWRLGGKFKRWPLPNRFFRLTLAFGAFTGVLLQYGTVNGATAGSALLVVMVALKFLESHTHRDQVVLMIIAYFLVFASLLYERTLLMLLYLLGFVWVTTAGLLQLGRHGVLLPSWPTAKLAARLLLQAVPIMLILFLLFPRLPGPLWGMPGDASSGTSGLSESMSPGDITNLGLSDEVAFRVEFETAPPSAAERYWRGPVLSLFSGRTWTRSPGMRRQVIRTLEFVGPPVEYRVVLPSNARNWLFALDMPESWTTERRRNITMGSDYQLRAFAAQSLDTRIDYRVTSYTNYVAREALTPSEQEAFTSLPADSNPRTRAMISEWLAEGATQDQIIERALDVFRGDTFFYTLTPPPLGLHTADEFIFETQEGFCEHYASAFAIMMRIAGIPARIVTGYQGGEFNGIGDYYVVRQANAHAWAELWLGDRGWVRVDPVGAVAPDRISFGSARSALGNERAGTAALVNMRWIRTALMAWDAANTYWNDWVIGYGPQLQRSLLQNFGIERPSWRKLAVMVVVVTAAILTLLTLYLGWTFRRQRNVDAAAQSFAKFTRKLRNADVAPRLAGEGPRAYALRARGKLPHAAADIDRVVARYLEARYEPDPTGASSAELALLVSRFRVAPSK